MRARRIIIADTCRRGTLFVIFSERGFSVAILTWTNTRHPYFSEVLKEAKKVGGLDSVTLSAQRVSTGGI